MKALFIYESHLDGGYYITNKELTQDEIRCESCGDSDIFITKIKNISDVSKFDKKHKFLKCNKCGAFVYQSDGICQKCNCRDLSLTRVYEDIIDEHYIKKFIKKLKKLAKEEL